MSRQAPASLQQPERGQESPTQLMPLAPKSQQLLSPGRSSFALHSSSQGGLSSNHSRVGRRARNIRLPTGPLSFPGTFYATSISWNICTASYFCNPNNIFKHAGGGDFMEEVCVESFYKENIVLLFKRKKKSFFM